MTSDFETVLLSWKEECGGKVPVKDASRIAAYLDLIESLQLNGFSKETITYRSNVDRIIRESCNPNHKNAKAWIDRCKSNWATAIVKVWPATLAKFDHEAAEADRVKKLEAITKSEAEATAKVESEREARKASEKTELEDEYVEPSDELMFSKPIDRSQYEKLPQAEVIYDDEMRKFLGFVE